MHGHGELCISAESHSVNSFRFIFSEWTGVINSSQADSVKVSKCDLLMNLMPVCLSLPAIRVEK